MSHATRKAVAAASLKAACGSAYDFVREALTICGENDVKVARELRQPGTKSGRDTVQAAARAHLATGGAPVWPTDGSAQAAVDEAFRVSGSLEAATTAYALAELVDDLFAQTLRNDYAAGGTRTLADGDLVVAPEPGLKSRFEGTHGAFPSLGPRGAHLVGHAHEPTRLTNSRLASGLTGGLLKVVVDMSRCSELDVAFDGLPAAATVHPLGHAGAFDDGKIIAGGLFGLGPKKQEQTWAGTVQQLIAAATNGAQIAVVPELDLGSDIDPDLTGQPVPALVVSGSRHRTDGKDRVNDAVLHLNGLAAFTHRKLAAFGAAGEKDPGQRESICCGDTIQVLYSPTWCVVVLICADVNSQPIMGLLNLLRANIVLVPAMSRAIGFFGTHLAALSVDNQALCVVANHPPNTSTPGAVETSVFVFPSKQNQVRTHKNPGVHVRHEDWSHYQA